MARLIDADTLIQNHGNDVTNWGNPYAVKISSIFDAPTVDAVEVVRCRECKYHEDTSVTEYEHCCLLSKTVRYNDFCSYGERKEGDD